MRHIKIFERSRGDKTIPNSKFQLGDLVRVLNGNKIHSTIYEIINWDLDKDDVFVLYVTADGYGMSVFREDTVELIPDWERDAIKKYNL